MSAASSLEREIREQPGTIRRLLSAETDRLAELAARWAPEVKDSFHKGSTHLALDDIRESIAELQHYRKHFIKA